MLGTVYKGAKHGILSLLQWLRWQREKEYSPFTLLVVTLHMGREGGFSSVTSRHEILGIWHFL